MCMLVPKVAYSTVQCYDAYGNLISETEYADLLPVESGEVKTETIEYPFDPAAETALTGRYTYGKGHEVIEPQNYEDRTLCYDPLQGRWFEEDPLDQPQRETVDCYCDGTPMQSSDRHQLEGQELDTATEGYYDDKARCYDPTTGRWLSGDPLGFGPGDSNLFRYPVQD